MSSNLFQSDSDSRSTSLNNIEAIIKCYICLGKIRNPCMCPLCQKLTCEECIEKWLLEKKSQCPHCRVNLNFNQLIHLSFMTDVANYIDKMNSSKKVEESEICEKHQIQNLYYCIECETPLCSDCYMLEENHKKHKIKKIDEVFKNHIDMIKQEKEGLDFEENTLRKYLKDIGEKIIEIGNAKYKKIKEAEEFFKNIRNQIQIQSQDVITNLLEKKQNIESKLSEIQNYSKNFSFRIKNSSKNEIISESNNLIKELKEIKLKILTQNSDNIDKITNNNLTLTIKNPLVPNYETGIYEIKNYEKIKSEKVMYSPDMWIGGLIWKLKVYPRGNITSKGESISVFLELQSGVSEPSKYFYVLELVNFKKRRNFYMEYSSNFSNGECWGYSNFYKIKKLKEDGFINQDGDMIIKVHIRPESFEQLSRDLKGYIKTLEYHRNKKNKNNESIMGEEDEEEDEEKDDENNSENDKSNLTRNYDLNFFKFTNEFFEGLDLDVNDIKRKTKFKGNKYNKLYDLFKINKNHSFDDFDLNKNNNENKNIKNEKKKEQKNCENNKNKKISDNNNIFNSDVIKKDKAIPIKKSNNNSQIALSINDTENNNINKQNILKSDIKNNNFNNEGNNNNINNINSINLINNEQENKFKSLNQMMPPNFTNKIKLSNMAKIDISFDSEEEQKKANEDPFLIPKKKSEQFIMDDDSFDIFFDSMKFPIENEDKKDIKNNNNDSNGDLLDELRIKYKMEKKKGKEGDYGRGRNNNANNYERNYIPFRNYYNFYGNGNGQSNMNNNTFNDNSSSVKFPNDFDAYKKKYYK